MIINCMKDLMVRKYNNYKVYIHNLAGFDAYFLLKILVNLGIVKPIIHHGKIISINFKYNKYEVTFRYCNIDCISLYQILIKFNSLIYKLFEINIHKYPTLSSLAFAIYRTHFLKKDTIAQLSGQIAKDIRQSYTGGAVDMYIPENLEGEELYVYDVNSLYPSQMESQLMPINHPTLFSKIRMYPSQKHFIFYPYTYFSYIPFFFLIVLLVLY